MKKKSNKIKAIEAVAVFVTMVTAGLTACASDTLSSLDEIYYDSGPATFLTDYIEAGTIFAVRFTPDRECTLLSANISGFGGNGMVRIYVLSDNNGYPDVPLVTPFYFYLIGDGTFHQVTFNPPVNVGAQDFHIGWQLVSDAPPYATTDDDGATDFRSKVRTPEGSIFNLTNDLCIRATVEYSNTEPTAPIISGPSTGNIGVEYTFTISAADPDGDNLTYHVDWKDGTTNDYGPFPSGQSFEASYTWTATATYNITAVATDVYGVESAPGTHTIVIQNIPDKPVLEITIKTGLGLGVIATIENTGEAAATNVSWTISLDGGFIFIGAETTGTIDVIPAGDSATVKAMVIGLGKSMITVSATCDEGVSASNTATGFVLLFLVLGVY